MENKKSRSRWAAFKQEVKENWQTIVLCAVTSTVTNGVIACVKYEDGSSLVKVLHTISGEWRMSGIPRDGKVTHWMPLPEPPERDDE